MKAAISCLYRGMLSKRENKQVRRENERKQKNCLISVSFVTLFTSWWYPTQRGRQSYTTVRLCYWLCKQEVENEGGWGETFEVKKRPNPTN